MTIKHLVISGGGPTFIQMLGAIQHFEQNNIIVLNDVTTIYGTSAGAIVGIMISLKYDWTTLYEYIVKRPWHEVFEINIKCIINAFAKGEKGLFNLNIIEKCFKPLFDAKNISLNITLNDFYKITKIEQHFFTFDINDFKIEDISYKTHPDLTLLLVLQMTCAIPFLFTPVCINNKCYIDGGFVCNYPIKYCIENNNCNPNEILGFKNKYKTADNDNIINDTSTLFEFILNFILKIINSISENTTINNNNQYQEFICDTKELLSYESLKNAFNSENERKILYQNGIDNAEQYIKQIIMS